jgi:hypothetical protein
MLSIAPSEEKIIDEETFKLFSEKIGLYVEGNFISLQKVKTISEFEKDSKPATSKKEPVTKTETKKPSTPASFKYTAKE